MTSNVWRYGAATLGVVLPVGALLMLAFHGPGDTTAIWVSAAVAVVVQLTAFALARLVGRGGNIMARMGSGALVRFVAVIAYALIVGLVVRLPVVAALLSLFVFFFLSTLLEPLLIKS